MRTTHSIFATFITESDNEGTATQERQIARELKLLTTKLKTFREKQAASYKERRILREQLKKRQKELKEEKKKYKVLHKEVDKMAKLMKEAEDDDVEYDPQQEEEVSTRQGAFLRSILAHNLTVTHFRRKVIQKAIAKKAKKRSTATRSYPTTPASKKNASVCSNVPKGTKIGWRRSRKATIC